MASSNNITYSYMWHVALRLLFIIAFCLLLLLLPIKSFAAAWLQVEGEGLVIGNIQPYVSCDFWNQNNNLQRGPCFRQLSINPYVEYGYSSNLTLIFNPTFQSYSQPGLSSPFGLAYVMVGGRFLLKQQEYDMFSFQALFNQPFKSKNFGNNMTPSAQYALLYQQPFTDLRIMYGTAGALDVNGNNFWYADAEASFRPYFAGAADEIHIDFMLGIKTLDERLTFEIQELNTIGLRDPKNPQDPNYDLITIMPNVTYWYRPNMALQFGVKQDVYGRNFGSGTAPFTALWFTF